MTRRGHTLVELLVGVTLTALIAVEAGRVAAEAARVLRGRAERMALEQAVRAAAGAVRNAVESAGRDSAAGADLSVLAGGSFIARAVRAEGTACSVTAAGIMLRSGSSWWSALRQPVAGRDSLLVLSLRSDSVWVPLPLAGAGSASVCPDGTGGLWFPSAVPGGLVGELGAGSQARVFEPVELRGYSSSSAMWFGLRSVPTLEAIQPLAGPLLTGGVNFRYLAVDGSTSTVPSKVAGMVFGLSALTEHAGGVGLVRAPTGRVDSLSLFVARRSLR